MSTIAWVAFIVVQTSMSMPITNATNQGPTFVAVGQEAPANPDISLNVKPAPTTHVDRLTGVEADTYVNMPATASISFPSKDMCDAAAVALRNQTGILSVSCIQTQ